MLKFLLDDHPPCLWTGLIVINESANVSQNLAVAIFCMYFFWKQFLKVVCMPAVSKTKLCFKNFLLNVPFSFHVCVFTFSLS